MRVHCGGWEGGGGNKDSTSREANIPIGCITHMICTNSCQINGISSRNAGGYDPAELFGCIVNRGGGLRDNWPEGAVGTKYNKSQ